ncbi:prolyl aminopeptidase [Streptomyces sp. SL13]|uniref:Proline iminopeptidase n=1 Tax=Streptantibioticus silvisoli TaxID=2705255 RepID=A0AA90GYV5_9ACTN|nr:prolyl aminopeptidase [Streptantibioticus silvisoli]MDI5969006.1 prolyl aminopeptidase [Streptantibioticus silvisoli]
MDPLHPLYEPYDHGMLDVGDGNLVYWEVCGDPRGRPAVVLHGGPGSGCAPGYRRYFDPERYRVVLFDQRGCGRSLPHASDPATDMSLNTTAHLVADLERLREHLGIDRWVVTGTSWGSTLALAYAERHTDRVTAVVIDGVTSTRRSEIDWLYNGVGRFLPEQWQRFRAAVPGGGDVVADYARALENPDPAVRLAAARAFHAWEDATISLEPKGPTTLYSDRDETAMLARARICAHYFSRGAFLEEGVLLREAGRLARVPGTLIHGRFDLGSPLETAWRLARAMPLAQLVVIEGEGHTGGATMKEAKRRALDALVAG